MVQERVVRVHGHVLGLRPWSFFHADGPVDGTYCVSAPVWQPSHSAHADRGSSYTAAEERVSSLAGGDLSTVIGLLCVRRASAATPSMREARVCAELQRVLQRPAVVAIVTAEQPESALPHSTDYAFFVGDAGVAAPVAAPVTVQNLGRHRGAHKPADSDAEQRALLWHPLLDDGASACSFASLRLYVSEALLRQAAALRRGTAWKTPRRCKQRARAPAFSARSTEPRGYAEPWRRRMTRSQRQFAQRRRRRLCRLCCCSTNRHNQCDWRQAGLHTHQPAIIASAWQLTPHSLGAGWPPLDRRAMTAPSALSTAGEERPFHPPSASCAVYACHASASGARSACLVATLPTSGNARRRAISCAQ